MSFAPHDTTSPINFPKEEEKVLAYWREIDAFQESLRQSEGKPEYVFMDGPPFATGLPHYGHILMGTVKDIMTRFAHSTGHHVTRRFGWDCHGLPIEHEIDKRLGVKSKDDVLKMGIDAYNAECRKIVMRYASEWRVTVERMGRWIDFDNDYKTLNTTFMESVWWVFKSLFDKGLVYRGSRVMPYSTACTTPLANFELSQDTYKMVSDPAVTVAFNLVDDPTVAILIWTTLPWTIVANLAVCVNPKMKYLKIRDHERDRVFIIYEGLLTTLYKDPKKAKFTKLEEVMGKDLVGLKYTPAYPYFYEKYKETGFRIAGDDYVTADSGTGLVSMAPAFGEDDQRVSLRDGIFDAETGAPCPVDEAGIFTKEAGQFAGVYVRDADKLVIKNLKERGHLIVHSNFNHSYPHCWRSGVPLIYKAIPSWFVRVHHVRDQLVENNKATRWVPASVGENRFQNWLANAIDWNVSRNRYWGTPLPIWISDDYEEMVCVGSIEELERLSGVTGITDLHRDKIDHITIPSQKGKGVLRRTEEVFDCWFESGSMPYASIHYPFENNENFLSERFPADFVSEAMDQTRGWFYTLLVLATLLYGKAPWKNLIVCGLVLAADGKKMSKSQKNYPDPNLVINAYGADAVRLFLINSPVVRGDTLRFREDGVKDVISRVFLPWVNSFRFLLGQISLLKKENDIDFKWDPNARKSDNVMDRWMLASCQTLITFVKTEMEAYRMYTVVPRLLDLIDDMTNWYIRFNRKRLKGENGPEDTCLALNTLFETLLTLCRTMSCFTPFLTESIYQGLRPYLPQSTEGHGELGQDFRSIHFLTFPKSRADYFDVVIERQVARMRAVINLGRNLREQNKISQRTPLKEVVVYHPDAEYLDDVQSLKTYIEDELNVREVTLTHDEERCGIKWKVGAEWSILGKKLRKDLGKVRNALPDVTPEEVKSYVKEGKIIIAGVELVEGDLIPMRYVENPQGNGDAEYIPNHDNDVVILLDKHVRPEFEEEALGKELINRIQKARKEAGCVATDEIDVYLAGNDEESSIILRNIVQKQENLIRKVLKEIPQDDGQRDKNRTVLYETATENYAEVGSAKFRLILIRR